MKTTRTVIVLIMMLGAYALHAQEVETKLSGNTSSQGFTIKDNTNTSLFSILGDGRVGFPTVSPGNTDYVQIRKDGDCIQLHLTGSAKTGLQVDNTNATGGLTGGCAIRATSVGPDVFTFIAKNLSTTSNSWAVIGWASSPVGGGVGGDNSATTGTTYGVEGGAHSPDGFGVYGENYASGGTGVCGSTTATTGSSKAIFGKCSSATGWGGYFLGRGYFSANVGIGTEQPDAALHVVGQVKITGGSPGMGKVLTSDANGLASWANSSSSCVTLDQAYNCGGAGSGRTVTANSGAVAIGGVDGFVVGGTYNSGTIPATGIGTRMMFYPRKAAFRAGSAGGAQWDDANVGGYSVAMGANTVASGYISTALGYNTTANADYSTALGQSTTAGGIHSVAMGQGANASGQQAFAMGANTLAGGSRSVAMGMQTNAGGANATALGNNTNASNTNATAMGSNTTASGQNAIATGYGTTAGGSNSTAMGYSSNASADYSTAIGIANTASGAYSTAIGCHASTNNKNGSFIIGDNSTTTDLTAGSNNVFAARFAAGYVLYTNAAMSIGAQLGGNASSWSTISDSTKKCAFHSANGEKMLSSFAHMRLGSWNYRADQNNNSRHYGPMAQDWFAAFGHDGVGTIGNETMLASADVDGVLCIAVQALEKRTRELAETSKQLKTATTTLEAQSQEITGLRSDLDALRREMQTIKTALAGKYAPEGATHADLLMK
jgi:hypothetical protein